MRIFSLCIVVCCCMLKNKTKSNCIRVGGLVPSAVFPFFSISFDALIHIESSSAKYTIPCERFQMLSFGSLFLFLSLSFLSSFSSSSDCNRRCWHRISKLLYAFVNCYEFEYVCVWCLFSSLSINSLKVSLYACLHVYIQSIAHSKCMNESHATIH